MATDLHIHSTASDGTLTPADVVEAAARAGLTAIAIADHDTVAGVEPGLAAAAAVGMDMFPAVEISTQHGRFEVHILGYLIDLHNEELVRTLGRIQSARRSRAREMVTRLQALGLPIGYEQVEAVAHGQSVGRPHVAAALVAQGLVTRPQQAFDRYLRRGGPAYVERYRISAHEGVELVHAAEGLAVIAHPGLLGQDGIIPDLAHFGLDGIEAYHVDHTPAQTAAYLRLAERLGLVVTGGSDSHGPKGPKPVAVGQVAAPDSCAEAVRAWGAARGRWPLRA